MARRLLAVSPSASLSPAASLDFDRVYAQHFDLVARWVFLLGGPGTDVEDLTHEVFTVVLRKLDRFRGEAKLSTWIYRIAANVVRNDRRKRRVRRWLGGTDPGEALVLASHEPDQHEELERRQREALLYRALDRLSEPHRVALIAFELEGASGAEVAERLGITVGTLWVRLHRARAELLKRVTELDPEAGR